MNSGPGGMPPWEQGDQPPQQPVYPPAYPQAYPPAYGYAQPYAGGYPGAPYGVHPVTGVPYSDKSKIAAGLLQLLLPFVGICGVGRLYAGNIGLGLVQLLGMFMAWVLMIVFIGFLLVPAFWLWGVIDGIVMLAGEPRDGHGRPLRS